MPIGMRIRADEQSFPRLLEAYRNHIASLSAEYRLPRPRQDREEIKREKEVVRWLALHENEVLEQLRKARKSVPSGLLADVMELHGNLLVRSDAHDYEDPDDDYVPIMALPTSPSSARIMTSLYKEEAYSAGNSFLLGLQYRSDLCREYKQFLSELAQSNDPAAKRFAIFTLYTCGIDQARHETQVRQWAMESQSPREVEHLLFSDGWTSNTAVTPRVSEPNVALARTLAQSSSNLETRVVCARYLALSGHKAHAQSSCETILGSAYQDENATFRDSEISHVRKQAADVLFYLVANERAFRTVFDIASGAVFYANVPDPVPETAEGTATRAAQGLPAPTAAFQPRPVGPLEPWRKLDDTWPTARTAPKGNTGSHCIQMEQDAALEMLWRLREPQANKG